jgi:hypothetical protein
MTDQFNNALIEEWLETLESGRIEQTKSNLIQPDGSMCCLGVLSSLSGGKYEELGPGYFGYRFGDNKRVFNGYPPEEILNEVGLTTYCPKDWTDKTKSNMLVATKYASMNDDGRSFRDIAAQLRKDYEAKGIL